MDGLSIVPNRLMVRFRRWARRARLTRKLAYGLAFASVLAGLGTFVTMTGSSPLSDGTSNVLLFLYLDAVLLLLLGAVIGGRLFAVWGARRRGLAGSALHIRLVVLFSVVAVTPAILVAVFSSIYLNFGIQDWFSSRVRTAVEESMVVAQAYLKEHQQAIRGDALAMASDLNRQAHVLMRRPQAFNQALSAHAAFRDLPEALVMDSTGRVLAKARFSFALEFDMVPRGALDQAQQGEVVMLNQEGNNRVRAVVRLDRFLDAFLIVGRFVEPLVLERIERTSRAVAQYQDAERQQEGFQITFVMIFVLVALLLLLASIWVGMNLATQLAGPISDLIVAADRVRKGDLSVRVHATASSDEISSLSRAFNRMTDQLDTQQQGLIEANRQLDERRRFTETVLAGVSAGVIGLDGEGRIHLPNRSASDLLHANLEQWSGKLLVDAVPEMADLWEQVRRRPERVQRSEIAVQRDGKVRNFLVRMVGEKLGGDVVGFVVTFDDITELQSAQRKAAWADVARRIAHEIKNPLTPIQLSAERLRRRYLKEIQSDPETFITCTETIVRQVEDIGRMVDEFSDFARMPQPTMREENLGECVRQAVFLERNRHPDVEYDLAMPDGPVTLRCDQALVGRALTNVLKNAAESILGRDDPEEPAKPGRVVATLDAGERDGVVSARVIVEDNGVGFPGVDRHRLTEPYVTTRDKGTGLGLAIVKKIMEEHGGDLLLEDRIGGGARVTLAFPAEDTGATGDPSADIVPAATPPQGAAADIPGVPGMRRHGT